MEVWGEERGEERGEVWKDEKVEEEEMLYKGM